MRYAFNMVTMMKEKVNTHFSFPLQLNMAPYTEDFLMGDKQDQGILLFITTFCSYNNLSIGSSFSLITYIQSLPCGHLSIMNPPL